MENTINEKYNIIKHSIKKFQLYFKISQDSSKNLLK